jgi:hypothetical protein
MLSLARTDALERLNELAIPFAETNQNFDLYRKHLPPLFR